MWLNCCVCRKIGKYVTVCGKHCVNVASLNFLGMSGRSDIEVSRFFSAVKSVSLFTKSVTEVFFKKNIVTLLYIV